MYDPRLRRFLTPDPLSEVPVRFPLECVISPCDEDETNPDEGAWAIPDPEPKRIDDLKMPRER